MNSDFPKTPREEMEAWLTALLLGELSEGEAAAVRALMAHDPELAQLHDRLQQAIALVREAMPEMAAPPAAAEPLQLSPERRQRLLTGFKIPPLKPQHRKPKPKRAFRLLEVLAAISLVAVLAALLLPSLGKAKSRGQRQSAAKFGLADDKTLTQTYPVTGTGLNNDYSLNVVGHTDRDVRGTELAARRSNNEWGFGSGQSGLRELSVAEKPAQFKGLPARTLAPTAPIVLPSTADSSVVSREEIPLIPAESVGVAFAASVPAPGPSATPPPPQPALPDLFSAESLSASSVRMLQSVQSDKQVVAAAESQALFYTNSRSDSFGYFTGVDREHIPRVSVYRDGALGGGMGGGGGGVEKIPVLGDQPSFGIAFRGKSESSASQAEAGSKIQTPPPQTIAPIVAAPVNNDSVVQAGRGTKTANLADYDHDGVTSLHSSLSGTPLPTAEPQNNPAATHPSFDAGNTILPNFVPRLPEGEARLGNSFARVAEVATHQNRGDLALGVPASPAPAKPSSSPTIVLPLAQDEMSRSSQSFYRAVSGESGVETGEALASLPQSEGKLLADKLGEVRSDPEQSRTSVAKDASQLYFEKRRELGELESFGRVLGRKLDAEKTDAALPKTTMVEVLDRAEPAEKKTGGRFGGLLAGDYASTARLKVGRAATETEGMAGGRTQLGYDPYFIQTEVEAIQSDAVLGQVVDSLKLDETWAGERGGKKLEKAEAIGLLKGKLDVRPSRGTSQVEIQARSAKPDEAARIANAVAEAYKVSRREERLKLASGGIAALEGRYQEQEQKIREARKEVEQLREELSLADLEAGGKVSQREVDAAPIRKPARNAPIPQPEIQTGENNFSTFSLNVSDVSFKLAMASLEKGQMPDAASIRSEEFINAFDYRDPEPAADAPIAFAWERARYPFAHNRDLLRFSLKTAAAGRQAGRALNLVLLLDNSGSMERADRVRIIREALRVLAGQLQPQDKLSVITFARTPRLVADGISGDRAGEVAGQVSELTPQGGTNLEEAMNLAYQTALRHYLTGGLNRVVLLTDGAANLGDVAPESLKQKVEAHRRQGVALDCFGIGWEGFNDDLLEVLSRNGDGRYGFLNSPEEAAADFVGQLAGTLKVAASDVKVQVEFNPRRVTSYRQIGYAKHQLTKEQFRDNTVDAAEIAAQEAGNALYTVEVNAAGDGPLGMVRVRYKIPGTTDYREHAWDVPYTGNALSLEQASPAMRLAASASAFAEWLVASPFAAEVAPDRVLGVLSGVPEIYGADARPKKLEWMIRQAKSMAGE